MFYKCLDVLASSMFLVGSICFLPTYAWNVPVFILGCRLFVYGSAAYSFLCVYNLSEAVNAQGCRSLEALESGLYLWGSFCFLVGTLYYWPEQGHVAAYIAYMEDTVGGGNFPEAPLASPLESVVQIGDAVEAREIIARLSSRKRREAFGAVHDTGGKLAVYVNSFSHEFYGSILFVVGSVFFALGATTNLVKQRNVRTRELSNWVASLMQLSGSVFFVMGSVAFLPAMGATHRMACIGSYSFLVGSLLYLVGAGLRAPPSSESAMASQVLISEGSGFTAVHSPKGGQRPIVGAIGDMSNRKGYNAIC